MAPTAMPQSRRKPKPKPIGPRPKPSNRRSRIAPRTGAVLALLALLAACSVPGYMPRSEETGGPVHHAPEGGSGGGGM